MSTILLCLALYAPGTDLGSDQPVSFRCEEVVSSLAAPALARRLASQIAPLFDVVAHRTEDRTILVEIIP